MSKQFINLRIEELLNINEEMQKNEISQIFEILTSYSDKTQIQINCTLTLQCTPSFLMSDGELFW